MTYMLVKTSFPYKSVFVAQEARLLTQQIKFDLIYLNAQIYVVNKKHLLCARDYYKCFILTI